MATAISAGASATPAPGQNNVFVQARNDFLALLSPSEQADLSSCPSVQHLILKLEKFQHIGNGGSRMKRSLEKVAALGNNLQPYFKIMETFCGAHPEWANIALGSLQLILQLASHFVTFFEKLCDVVETLNSRLPRYQEVYDTLYNETTEVNRKLSTALKASFRRLYRHLFEFYGAVARIFSTKCGKLKRPSVVVTSLMWKPFNVRFENILEKIKLDQKIVQEELHFASMGAFTTAMQNTAVREREAMESAALKEHEAMLARLSAIQLKQNEQAQEHLRGVATKWLNPPDYKAALEQAQDHRTRGTNEWLQRDPCIASWRSAVIATDEPSSVQELQDNSQLLWICGNPGSGKTVLAASTIHELKENNCHIASDCSPEVCYYFFNQSFNTQNSPFDAYRAIATQLFEYFNCFEKISNLYDLAIGNGATLQKASESEIVDTITQCLPHFPNLYFVVDAVDECSHSDRLIRQLTKWCESSPLKVLVLSRPDVAGLRRRIPKERRVELRGAHVNADIACYLEFEVEALVQEGLLSDDVDQARIVSHLVGRAEGMFLWARLIMGYLNGPAMTRAQRLATIMEENTEGLDQLDEMYKRIETRIKAMDRHSRRISQQSLMWVAHVSISSEALKDALFPEGWDVDPKGVSDQFEHAVIVVCGGLVEKGPQPGACFRYIHLTALEFVQRSSHPLRPITDTLIPSATVSKSLIATRCLSFLQSIPQRPLSGRLGEAASHSTLLGQWPLLPVSIQWIGLSLDAVAANNYSSTTAPEETLNMVDYASQFLKNRLGLMVWVEAWYNLCTSPHETQQVTSAEFRSLRDRIVNILTQQELAVKIEHYFATLRDFMNDITQLQTAWGSALKRNPHDIWGDVTVFTKSRFFVSTNAASAQCLAPEKISETGSDANKTVKPTFSVSMSSADGRQLAVLAIFPCEFFRKGWEDLTDIPSIQGSSRWANGDWGHRRRFPRGPATTSEYVTASSGWLATYEIFSILEKRCERRYQTNICLQERTVELCLRQYLRLRPGRRWECKFPLTIAPGLGHFSILNIIYYFNPDLEVSVGAQLPTSFNARVDKSWKPDTKRILDYSYSLSWSPDSRYLAFADLEKGTGANHDEVVCIAVFFVASSWVENQSLTLVKHTMNPVLGNRMSIINPQFHPVKSLFLFTLDARVFIWRFQEESSPTNIQGLPALLHDFNGSTVGFSHCGTAIAIIHVGRPWPELIPLSFVLPEASPLRSSLRKRRIDDTGDDPRPNKLLCVQQLDRLESKKDRSIAVAPSQVPSVLSSTSVVTLQGQGGPHGNMAIVKSKSDPNQIDVVYGNDDSANKLSVCKLPSHIPLGSASANITVRPSSYDSGRYLCTLAVNSKSAPVYESDERGAAEHLPIVVWKDTLAMRVSPWSGHLIEEKRDADI